MATLTGDKDSLWEDPKGLILVDDALLSRFGFQVFRMDSLVRLSRKPPLSAKEIHVVARSPDDNFSIMWFLLVYYLDILVSCDTQLTIKGIEYPYDYS